MRLLEEQKRGYFFSPHPCFRKRRIVQYSYNNRGIFHAHKVFTTGHYYKASLGIPKSRGPGSTQPTLNPGHRRKFA